MILVSLIRPWWVRAPEGGGPTSGRFQPRTRTVLLSTPSSAGTHPAGICKTHTPPSSTRTGGHNCPSPRIFTHPPDQPIRTKPCYANLTSQLRFTVPMVVLPSGYANRQHDHQQRQPDQTNSCRSKLSVHVGFALPIAGLPNGNAHRRSAIPAMVIHPAISNTRHSLVSRTATRRAPEPRNVQ